MTRLIQLGQTPGLRAVAVQPPSTPLHAAGLNHQSDGAEHLHSRTVDSRQNALQAGLLSEFDGLLSTQNVATISESAAGDYLKVDALLKRIASRTQLSTTGYQSAMRRINKKSLPDSKAHLTMSRAKEYLSAAKEKYPESTLASLAQLQKEHIYKTSTGDLLGCIEMNPEQLTECMKKCRAIGFANCDMQALEVALHLKHELGISNFDIYRNNELGHNYCVIRKCDTFPKGAILDSWSGQGIQELSGFVKFKMKHFDSSIIINKNMHEWVNNSGLNYISLGG